MLGISSGGAWIGVPGLRSSEPCALWFTEPPEPSGLGVLLLPPIGYEYSSSCRTLHDVSVALAERGCTVAQLDYPGTGDSGGQSGLDSWRRATTAAADALHDMGMVALVLVGVRLGGALALQVAEAVDPEAIALVAPVMSGRRFAREQRMLGLPDPGGSGGLTVGGYHLSSQVLHEVAAVQAILPTQKRVLVVGTDETPTAGIAGSTETLTFPGLRDFLERPAEEAVADPAFTEALAAWVSQHAPTDRGTARVREAGPSAAELVWNGGRSTESFVFLGPHGLPGVLSEPVGEAKGLMLLVNSGSDPHTGPGRAWVELARHLAGEHGWAVIRFDARGWGHARSGPDGVGRPYARSMEEDIVDAVTDLRARGKQRIVLAGLCAGAWMALRVALTLGVEGVIALNAQMYWQYGDPVEALLTDTTARRAAEIEMIAAAAASGRWDAEDDAGLRPPAALWLDELVERHVPIEMIFAEGDPGLDYLRTRLEKRLSVVLHTGRVCVTEVPDVDHSMHKAWLRPRVFAAFSRALDRMQG